MLNLFRKVSVIVDFYITEVGKINRLIVPAGAVIVTDINKLLGKNTALVTPLLERISLVEGIYEAASLEGRDERQDFGQGFCYG